jgi:hypothetical protein
MLLSLRPHPSTPAPQGLTISASATRTRTGLDVSFQLTGPLHALRLPWGTQSERADGLWRTTCFEAFLKDSHTPRYLELNLAPTGTWAAYRFDSLRHGMRNAAVDRAQFAFEHAENEASLKANFTGPDLPSHITHHLGLTAVIETDPGNLSYWALAHPNEKPDFHDPAGMTAWLALTEHP